MTVGDLLQRISSSELTEWMALYELRANPPKQTAQQARAVLSALSRKKG